MTREEAIKKLQKQKAEYLDEWVDYSGVAEAFDMAIEALSVDGDLISRQSAIDGFYEMACSTDALCTVGDYVKFLESMTAYQADRPAGHWVKDEVGTVICSVCKRPRRDNRLNHINFCNSCGTQMDSTKPAGDSIGGD